MAYDLREGEGDKGGERQREEGGETWKPSQRRWEAPSAHPATTAQWDPVLGPYPTRSSCVHPPGIFLPPQKGEELLTCLPEQQAEQVSSL